MSIAKIIILDELEQQMHPIEVESVILWALEYYSQQKKGTWGELIAYAIKKRILDAEKSLGETVTDFEKEGWIE